MDGIFRPCIPSILLAFIMKLNWYYLPYESTESFGGELRKDAI